MAAFRAAATTTTTTTLPIHAVSREMIDPAKFCGGAQDLDRFLAQLKCRFTIHSRLFHGEADQVDYALFLLGKWANHDDAELRKTQMTNPDEWGASLMTMSSPCLASFEFFETEIRRMYGDRDRK